MISPNGWIYWKWHWALFLPPIAHQSLPGHSLLKGWNNFSHFSCRYPFIPSLFRALTRSLFCAGAFFSPRLEQFGYFGCCFFAVRLFSVWNNQFTWICVESFLHDLSDLHEIISRTNESELLLCCRRTALAIVLNCLIDFLIRLRHISMWGEGGVVAALYSAPQCHPIEETYFFVCSLSS